MTEPKLTPTFQDNPVVPPVPPPPPSDTPPEPVEIKKPEKVAIIGTAPSSRLLAPFGDPSWQIWACSPGNMNTLPRVDRWFEIHVTLHWPENQSYGRPYLDWLKVLSQKIPVYAQPMYANPQGELPHAIVYPKEQMVKEFGPYFFTSSFSWMIALAMHEGAKEIALFGVDMASRDEYILQRPGAYKFFEEAIRRGIKIGAPYESDILQPPPLYGFCDSTPFMRKVIVREKELRDRITGMRMERDKLVQSITYLEGALEDLDYIKNIWGGAQEYKHG